ncbi:long-chain-fatty-acid--CoA ligase [Thermoactinomyces intermedius]|jgi:O-succinylbenzoate-CoA ligase|uniref:Long-chain-fatty-acid--CoA ligase n=1 Tax=Thermoactinomyces intermedius TaxID=2024 RepID=A0A8I1DC54_THEIN|nr:MULTISPECIES: long-chain-fatty-acid--CoA ligase [Thermoactinomyces]MBA4548279.1 long-chain-fatty-acid--CoA ligase [Thermoactinomyces intermedius]MBA4835157.1 long-chain-fatty-acid--CoA ligase [Thermoactinomyces intermedius]MBH8595123.1 long-chain-fatty-acid--CoA ligase [Thermoactinomyces intermedius]MBH8601940.1 long-chain-fatty-acid--CoA ligase [Thermoactinomyces sp. CICC 23799]
MVIGDLLNSRAELSPHLEALIYNGERLTFREYKQKVNQLANYLLSLNVKHGDRVAMLCKNTYAFPIIYLAAAKIGAVTVPVNCRLKPVEVQYILKDCQAKVLLYDEDFKDSLEMLPDCVEKVICVFQGERASEQFNSIFYTESDEEPNVEVHKNDIATIIYTSGTTGNPKGVISTHANVYAAGLANVNTLDLRKADRFLFVTPLFHISGMMFIINSLIRGMALVIASNFTPSQLWNLIDEEKITGMMSVPSMLPFMLEMLKTIDRDIFSLRGIVCGGSLVPENYIKAFHDLGFAVIQVYGATEFTGAATYFLPEMDINRCHSVGKGLYLTEIKIIDPLTGVECAPGEIGEILVRGDQVFAGYWNNPEETAKVLKNGWYHTQDLGRMDEEGYLYVIDRLRDMIVCGGEKVFPAQVEAVLLQMEGIAEVAVVGVKHPVWGELPRAYIVKAEGHDITKDEVIRHARENLADYKLIDVEFIEELPKNSMGKVLKYVLREYASRAN